MGLYKAFIIDLLLQLSLKTALLPIPSKILFITTFLALTLLLDFT